jgi:hypothetical protein
LYASNEKIKEKLGLPWGFGLLIKKLRKKEIKKLKHYKKKEVES